LELPGFLGNSNFLFKQYCFSAPRMRPLRKILAMNCFLILIALLMLLPRQGSEKKGDSLFVKQQQHFPEIDQKLELCYDLRYTSPDSAMVYCRAALYDAQKKAYNYGIIRAHLLMGILHDVSSQYDSALYHYRTSLAHSHEVGDTLRVASNNANIGLIFFNMGNFREAMDYFLNSLGYFEQANHLVGMASTYNNLGMIYSELDDNNRALDYYFKALEIRKEINDYFGIGAALTNIGSAYSQMDSMQLAINYLRESIRIKDSIQDRYGLPSSTSLLGAVYLSKDYLDSARIYLYRSIESSKDIESKGQEVNAYLIYQGLLIKNGRVEEAIGLNEKSLEMAREIGSLKHQSTAYRNLSRAYEMLGNTDKAFEYYKRHIEAKEQLMSHDQINQVFQLELEYEREKKASEIALLNRQAEINALQIETQRLLLSRRNSIMVAIVIIFFATLLLAYLYYMQQKSKEKLKLNKTLAEVQKRIARGAIEAEIKERQRIGEELHDSFGQILSLIKLNLTKAQKMHDMPSEKREQMLDHAVALSNKAFVDLRDISHNMSPIMLKTKGLALSVKDLLDRIDETGGYKISFEVVDMEGSLEPFVEFTLFRTIQELLNNVLNHAQATEITFQMVKDEGDITIMVEDNGKGFDPEHLHAVHGMGLQNAVSRIKNLNGEIIFDSAPGRGTIITIFISTGTDEKTQ
jgi:two-component system, NarL family, sensor kinase